MKKDTKRIKKQSVPEGNWYFVFDTEDTSRFDFFDNAEEAQECVRQMVVDEGRSTENVSVVKGRWLSLTAGFVEEKEDE